MSSLNHGLKMNTRICCASCRVEFDTDVNGETLCATCDQREWLESQQRLGEAMAERRRAKMHGVIPADPNDTRCATCHYPYDHGPHGARICPTLHSEGHLRDAARHHPHSGVGMVEGEVRWAAVNRSLRRQHPDR